MTADRRGVADIRAGGVAWTTEAELAWLCDIADGLDEADPKPPRQGEATSPLERIRDALEYHRERSRPAQDALKALGELERERIAEREDWNRLYHKEQRKRVKAEHALADLRAGGQA